MPMGLGLGVGVGHGRAGGMMVGGQAIGSPGAVGGQYEGYILSAGDDFNSLDILGPAKPSGKYWTTRTYSAGQRNNEGALDTLFDTDPLMTGDNDNNRGVPVGYSNMSVSGSVLSLLTRNATTQEQVNMNSSRHHVAAMISGAGAFYWYPGAATSGDIILEARIRTPVSPPAGWHPTFWFESGAPVFAYESDEFDHEGTSAGFAFRYNLHTAGSATGGSSGTVVPHDGGWHTITFIINATNVRRYVDGVLNGTLSNGNAKSQPQYAMLTNHIFDGTFSGETYSQAAWDAQPAGASLDMDWWRVWRRSGSAHYKPLASVADQNVDYGSSLTFALPSAATLWGDGSVTEYLQVIFAEENEPGVTHAAAYLQFPTGVSYNSGTRQVIVNITSGKSGRLNFAMYAWKSGTTGEPLRFAVNVGPVINLSSLSYNSGAVVSVDVYAAVDCGVLTTNGVSKAKSITITGLTGSGLSYSDTTGLLTGTAVGGSYTAHIVATNSVGQQVTKDVTVTVAALQTDYTKWAGPGWFDASDAATVTLSGSNVTKWTNKRSGGGDLNAYAPTASNLAIATAVQNGKNAIRLLRDVSTSLSEPSLGALVTDQISTAQQGDDLPYTVIIVCKLNDANTRFVWSWSHTVDTTNSKEIALVSRTSASSVRRQINTATPNDVSFGSGEASGAAVIIAVKQTGTAVSIWKNSTTKVVNAAAQDATAYDSTLIFRLGAAENVGASSPTYAKTQGNTDYFECVVEGTARADAEIQQAITDLATKWGITLS